jgi:hypothetical protein
MFRVPTLYFLSKVLVLWTVILLQTAELFPSWKWRWLVGLGKWAAEKEMEDVCWLSFGVVCGALCVGALTRGLEGAGASANTSPFNLVREIQSNVLSITLTVCISSLDMHSCYIFILRQ